ncbi:MAG: hypothetical protein J7K87_01445 [Candidatus Aenigmarchaeota archaeon]|nr:hypothetical protein [Candidatus Aenigmarchaeota archaeon]
MAKNKYDFNKIKKIIRVLLKNPDGIWLRKLSRDSRLPVSTIHYYLESVLGNMVENVGVRDEDGKFFGLRVIRLRNGVFKQLSLGNLDRNLMRLLKANELISDST